MFSNLLYAQFSAVQFLLDGLIIDSIMLENPSLHSKLLCICKFG